MRKSLFLILVLSMLFASGCSLGLGKRVSSDEVAAETTAEDTETPTEATEDETPPEESDPLQPTTYPIEAAAATLEAAPTEPPTLSLAGIESEAEAVADEVVSLLGGPVPDADPTLPAPDAEASNVIRQSRYNATRYSFEPAAGWEMIEIDADTLLIRQTGDEGVYAGAASDSAYIYLEYTDTITDGTLIADVLADMAEGLNGVQIAEKSASPVIDGLRGMARFVEGKNDAATYRAWLVAFPLQSGVLRGVFRGGSEDWASVAPEMNSVLVTLRWPQL